MSHRAATLPLRQGEYHEVGRGYVYLSLSAFRFPLSVYIIPPPPAGTPPVSGGESKRTPNT